MKLYIICFSNTCQKEKKQDYPKYDWTRKIEIKNKKKKWSHCYSSSTDIKLPTAVLVIFSNSVANLECKGKNGW